MEWSTYEPDVKERSVVAEKTSATDVPNATSGVHEAVCLRYSSLSVNEC